MQAILIRLFCKTIVTPQRISPIKRRIKVNNILFLSFGTLPYSTHRRTLVTQQLEYKNVRQSYKTIKQ